MRLSEELARTCVEKRAQPGLEDTRTHFEDLAQQEELLRSHADRLKDLSRERSLREDRSLGGYASTGISRLTPIPHTGTEALLRLPLIGAGGLAGYLAGKAVEPFDTADLLRTLRPASGKGGDALARAFFEASGQDKGKAILAEGLLQKADPEAAARAFRGLGLPGATKTESAANVLRKDLGAVTNVPRLKAELQNLARQTAGKEGLLPKFKGWRLGGALGGLALGSAVTGLPLAIRALMLKRHGGEAAVRAQTEAEAALARAEESSKSREELLARLEGKA